MKYPLQFVKDSAKCTLLSTVLVFGLGFPVYWVRWRFFTAGQNTCRRGTMRSRFHTAAGGHKAIPLLLHLTGTSVLIQKGGVYPARVASRWAGAVQSWAHRGIGGAGVVHAAVIGCAPPRSGDQPPEAIQVIDTLSQCIDIYDALNNGSFSLLGLELDYGRSIQHTPGTKH